MLMKATCPCKRGERAKNCKALQVLQPAQAPAQKLSVANAPWHNAQHTRRVCIRGTRRVLTVRVMRKIILGAAPTGGQRR